MNSDSEIITEAEGYLELEAYEAAWEILDELPPASRTTNRVLRLRMGCAFALRKLDIVETLAEHLRHGDIVDQRSSAAGFKFLAVEAMKTGDREAGKAFVKRAIRISPEIRAAIINEAGLHDLF